MAIGYVVGCVLSGDNAVEAALNVGAQIHTSPVQFGKVMAETQPRIAVGYHFFFDFDTVPSVLDG